ncbi:MAG: hypothetical protein KA714_02885 [Limnoraphis sp. WC205]|nr:hypothetical protein [Limnoraphis sp. WC205]
MIFFKDSDRIFENENTLLKKGGWGRGHRVDFTYPARGSARTILLKSLLHW